MLEAREYNYMMPSLSSFIFDREPLQMFPAEARPSGSRDPFGFREAMFGAGIRHADDDDGSIHFNDND